MLNVLLNRLKQGHRTSGYPKHAITMPECYRGRPTVEASKCRAGCNACVLACPTSAVTKNPLKIDLGQCLFCGRCAEACQERAVSFTRDHRLSANTREALVVTGVEPTLTAPLPRKPRGLFRHSFKLRQVSAGGCNACEADLSVLQIVTFDMFRFGLSWVASPRHADAVVVTGPVTTNMAMALEETYKAVPAPKLVIAVGACAISGGPYKGAPDSRGIPTEKMPIDLFIPGCPPHPYTMLDGILRLLGRIK
ncbi:MAG: 4Fe-4S binding protein [Myxococcota bacterium]|jgi:Ni,Fe-hydrogenase III small subunit/ferredoxin|nr:4Fe-4S binding protein [Myxococcota bacterium]